MKIGSLKTMLAAGLVLAFGALATPAGAQRADDMKGGQGGGQNPCVGDAQKLCNEFIPDRGKVASCLFKNKAEADAGVPRRAGRRRTEGDQIAQGQASRQAQPPPLGTAALMRAGRARGRFLLLRIRPMKRRVG